MVEKDGKKFYWCDEHQYPSCETKGMDVFHKPTDHDAWKARKDKFNKKGGKSDGPPTTTPAPLLLLLLLVLPLTHQSFLLQNPFRKLLLLLQGSLMISSRKFGKAAVMPWETKWPRS